MLKSCSIPFHAGPDRLGDGATGVRPDTSGAELHGRVGPPLCGLTSVSEVRIPFPLSYLCSPAHRNLTGSTLLLDGGLSLLRNPVIKS